MSFFTPEILTGLLSLAGGAFAGMMANNQKLLLASIDFSLNSNKQGNTNSNDAGVRNAKGASFLQRTVGIIIILVAFGGLLAVAYSGITTNYVYEEVQGKFLGIFGSGREKVKMLTAEGFLIPPYVKYSVISVVNFLFGASVVKLRRL